jgi:hypothetical protein
MKSKSLVISILIGLFLANVALLTANAQYAQPIAGSGDQVLVNQPYDVARQGNIMPQANFAQQTYPYAEPYTGVNAPYDASLAASPYAAPCAAPCAAPAVECGPYTSGFTYSAQQSSSFGPFSPPVAQASEQFYQYPGLTPFGAYPGAGYAAAGGVGFDPVTGYYGPYGAVTPLI